MWHSLPKRVRKASLRFLAEIDNERDWDNLELYSDARKIRELVSSAFYLYSKEWGSGFDVNEWEWPFIELNSEELTPSERFRQPGEEPWTVLFRRALEIAFVGYAECR